MLLNLEAAVAYALYRIGHKFDFPEWNVSNRVWYQKTCKMFHQKWGGKKKILVFFRRVIANLNDTNAALYFAYSLGRFREKKLPDWDTKTQLKNGLDLSNKVYGPGADLGGGAIGAIAPSNLRK